MKRSHLRLTQAHAKLCGAVKLQSNTLTDNTTTFAPPAHSGAHARTSSPGVEAAAVEDVILKRAARGAWAGLC